MCADRSPVTVVLTFDPEEMARRGRIGAHVTHSRHDARQLTAPAREAFLARFEQQVDPDGALSPDERGRRASYARKAHFGRLALKSVEVRRARKEAANVVVS